MTRQVMGEGINLETEVKTAASRTYRTTELQFLIEHVERAGVVDGAKGVQLFHHELPHRELVDDALLGVPLYRCLGDVEMHVELVLVFQSLDTAIASDMHLAVRGLDGNVAEGEGAVSTIELRAELERQLEVLQSGGEGVCDVHQQRGTRDGSGLEEERTTLFLAGQLDHRLLEVEFGVLHPYHRIVDEQFLTLLLELQVEVGDMQSGCLVMHVTLSELSHDTVFVGMGQFHLQVSHHLHVSVVKPPALGFLSTLMRQVVVGRPVYAVDRDDALAVGSLLKGDSIDEQGVIDMHGSLFLMMNPRASHLLYRSRQALVPVFLYTQFPYSGMLLVKHQVDILHDDTLEVEGKFFFFFFCSSFGFFSGAFLSFLKASITNW